MKEPTYAAAAAAAYGGNGRFRELSFSDESRPNAGTGKCCHFTSYPYDLLPDIRIIMLVRGVLAISALAHPLRDEFSSYSRSFEERCNYQEDLEPSAISHQVAFMHFGQRDTLRVTFSTVANLAIVKHPTPGGHRVRGFPAIPLDVDIAIPICAFPASYIPAGSMSPSLTPDPRTRFWGFRSGGQTAAMCLLPMARLHYHQHGYKVPQSLDLVSRRWQYYLFHHRTRM